MKTFMFTNQNNDNIKKVEFFKCFFYNQKNSITKYNLK